MDIPSDFFESQFLDIPQCDQCEVDDYSRRLLAATFLTLVSQGYTNRKFGWTLKP